MTRFWNYIYFFTFKTLAYLAVLIFFKPLSFILPVSVKRKNEAYNNFSSSMNNRKNGFNLYFALQFMFMSSLLLLGIACILFFVLFKIQVREELIYIISVLCFISYMLNYFALRKNNIYLKYFDEFEQFTNTKKHYAFTIFYHLFVATLFILITYFLIGIG